MLSAMSALGVKRTLWFKCLMSAFDLYVTSG